MNNRLNPITKPMLHLIGEPMVESHPQRTKATVEHAGPFQLLPFSKVKPFEQVELQMLWTFLNNISSNVTLVV
jgi:hypothetical protein